MRELIINKSRLCERLMARGNLFSGLILERLLRSAAGTPGNDVYLSEVNV